MNIALTTLFLAYEKLKECASNGGGKMVPDAVRALLTQFDKAPEAPANEIKDDVKAAAEQK